MDGKIDNQGDGAIVAGGGISGSVIVSGSNNIVYVGGPPPSAKHPEPAAGLTSAVDTIFISYSHWDDPFVTRLICDLNQAGHSVWVDRSDIKGGDDWVRAIAEGIVHSRAFILVATTRSLESEWVRDEVTLAKRRKRRIISALVEDVVDDLDFLLLGRFQGIKFFDADYAQALSRLLTALPPPSLAPSPSPSAVPDSPPAPSQTPRPQALAKAIRPRPSGGAKPGARRRAAKPREATTPSSAGSVDRPSASTPVPNPEAARLVATISDPAASTSDRIAAGCRLAEIGDPRPGVGLRPDGLPDIVWCDVPPGDFTFQNGDKRTLPAFRISKYPVTFVQFQAVLDAADGYADPRWWEGLHDKGRKQQKGGPGEQAFKLDNHPREGVSWYDAMAFCRWLSVKLGVTVTLPTEQQWEKAARGTDGRVYPYGNEFDADKGNTVETVIGQTSAVGAFPDGASPYGALDMSGNVLEWTLSEYDTGLDTKVSSDARRVVRGGAWGNNPYFARAGCRNLSDPGNRSNGVGFRLAASPAKTLLISEHGILPRVRGTEGVFPPPAGGLRGAVASEASVRESMGAGGGRSPGRRLSGVVDGYAQRRASCPKSHPII
ncbi:MAG: SUMF1/EgtB/PvdO family nonheme iron enzyme [Capsulimonadaceae bacterium]